MSTSQAQASLFKNKQQLPIQYISNGISLHSRAQSNNSLENLNSQTPQRYSQNYNGQQPQIKPSANVFPHQKIQSLLKNSHQQQLQQQVQPNTKSARSSPQRVISTQRGSIQTGISRTPTSGFQQDYSQFMNSNYQPPQQFNCNSISSFSNNGTNQSQTKMNILKYVGNQQNSNLRDQQQSQQQQQNTYSSQPQTLQRVASVQNYIKVGQLVNERDFINRNQAVPSSIGNIQYYDSQKVIQQSQNIKKSMPPIQVSNFNTSQLQPEILTPLMNNQPSFQNIDEPDERKCSANLKREECDFIQSPKISPSSFLNLKQSQPTQGILQLQNITNNLPQVQRNSIQGQAPKSRAISSIQFQGSMENQENYGSKEFTNNYSQDNSNLLKKGNVNLQNYQTNKILGQNAEALSNQIQIDQLINETRDQHNISQQIQQSNQQDKIYPNYRFESFQINDSIFQIASSTNNCMTSQFNHIQQDPIIPNQNIHQSVFNSEFPNYASVNLTNNIQTINMNLESKPNNNLNLVQFQQHQQKPCDSPESSYESKIEGNQSQQSNDDLNENPKKSKNNQESQETGEQYHNTKDNYELSVGEMKNENNSYQMSDREAYKQKFQQLQEENDRLSGIIKNLNFQVDEQTKLKQEVEQKLQQTELNVLEVEKNSQKLIEENSEIKRQVEELNSIVDQQNDMENRYFLLEEKARFYEEELALLRQQDKEKSTALANLQEHLSKLNDSEGEVQSVQLEEYISERVMQLLQNQQCLKAKNEQFQNEIEQKDQIIFQYEQDIQRLSEKINDYEDAKEKLQQYVEDRVKDELTVYYQKQQENENKTIYQIEQLNQELKNAKSELINQEELKMKEISLLNQEIDCYKSKMSEFSQQPTKYEMNSEILQSSTNEKQLQQKIADQERQIQDLISLNNMYIQQITELTNQHSKCYIIKTENETLKFQIDSLSFTIKDKESEIRQYQLKHEIKQNELVSLQKSYEQQIQQKQQDIIDLQIQIQLCNKSPQYQQETTPEQLHSQQNHMPTANIQLQQEKDNLFHENNELKEQLYNLENENRQLKMEYQQVEQNQQILEQEVYDLRQYIECQQNCEDQVQGDEESVELKREYDEGEQYQDEEQSAGKNLDSLMQVLSCQTIGTNYYQ